MSRYIRTRKTVDYHGKEIVEELLDVPAVIRDAGIFLIALVTLAMWGLPTYNVWQQGLAGKAALRRAEQDRQIAIQEARAKQDSAVMLAGAEIERAKGVAKANEIIADGLKGHDEYLRYLWIVEKAGTGVQREVIYVPTEANLPILEAQRLKPAELAGKD